MSTGTRPAIDPKELLPLAQGLGLGLCLLALLVLVAFVMGLSMSIDFGLPRV